MPKPVKHEPLRKTIHANKAAMTCKSGLVELFYLSASVENLVLGRGTVCAEVPFHSFTKLRVTRAARRSYSSVPGNGVALSGGASLKPKAPGRALHDVRQKQSLKTVWDCFKTVWKRLQNVQQQSERRSETVWEAQNGSIEKTHKRPLGGLVRAIFMLCTVIQYRA